jgi:HlyD family secretion protein
MFEVKDAVEKSDRQIGDRPSGGAPRWLIATLAVVVLGVVAFLAFRQLSTPPPATPPQTVAARRGPINATVSATGSVIAQSSAKLAFKTAGRIAEVSVKPGDTVKAGQVLARLDTTDLSLQVIQQRAALASAQAKLANLKLGPRPEDLQSAQAAVDSATAKLNQVKSAAQAPDVKAGQQGVAAAQAQLDQAKSNLATLKAGASSQDIKNAQLAVSQAQVSYSTAVSNRDNTCNPPATTSPTGTPIPHPTPNAAACTAAKNNVTLASYAITTAKNTLAKLQTPATAASVTAAQRAVDSAQAQLASAQAKLDQINAGAKPDDVTIAEAALTQAQAQLALKTKPYTDADLQSAQAAVDQAQAQLDLALYNLSNATLVAPFAGVINTVNINVGELTGASPAIVLVNPTDIRLDVNVDEADVANIALGQKATVTFDALKAQQFVGVVSAIAPSATIQTGVSIYVVSLNLTGSDQIRPGMTGSSSIVYAEKADVVLVPNRSIRRSGRDRSVDVLVGDKLETRPVTVGMSNDTDSEIIDGVSAGDLVAVTVTTSFQFGPPTPAVTPTSPSAVGK